MSLRIHHVALRTQDAARAERFYASVLGLEVRRRDADRGSVWLRAGDAVVMIERAEAGEPLPPAGSMDLVAFAVDDREAWRARLAAAGVAIEAETANTLYFRDPDGRRVGVSVYAFDAP
jgi:glyoxylase I family protein